MTTIAELLHWREDANQWEQTANMLKAELVQLRAALEPFARHADAPSLCQALGHIQREHLLAARKALGK